MATDVPNWVFSTFAFISFVMCMIPLPWHLEAWNTGTCMFMIWTSVGSLNLFINSVVWNSDAINKAPVWCDISSQIILAVSIALPASCLCIIRRLYRIASVQSVVTTPSQRRREVMIDLAIGIGIPVLMLALHPIVQSHRFVIFEKVGCYPFTLNSPPSYAIYFSWPVVIGLVSASYAVRTIRELAIRRAQFKEFLSTNKNLSSSRYFRLMGLACVDMVFTIPIGCVVIYFNAIGNQVQAWESWSNAHANFSMVTQVPAAVWQSDPILKPTVEMARWLVVLCAFVFFAFFGFADEAKRNYRLAYTSVAKRVGLSTGSWTLNGTNTDASFNSRSTTMPVYVTQQTEKKRDSLASFSSRMSLPDFGGALADVKRGALSPMATLSASGSRESLPRSPVDSEDLPLPMPTLPEATHHMTSSPPRYTPDVPHAV